MSATSSTSTYLPIGTIPLNKLIPWEGNVRKTGANEGIEELKASIAAHGVLQSLVVRKASRGKYAIVAGQRRYRALTSLAKGGSIESDVPVPCHILAASADPTEISLTENAVRVQMHPADQFEAFRNLIDAGSPPADIAARFGITEAVVKQRLRLARVSPTILAAYREGTLTLEQVQAFSVSDDHAAQERVHGDLPDWDDEPETIRSALTEGEITATDKRVRFVTLEAYEAAGGAIRRDLFAEDEDGIFVLDAQLLNRLAMDKLRLEAEAIRAEGWKWVEAALEFGYEVRGEFRRLHAERLPLSDEAAAERKALSDEYDSLFDNMDEEDDETSERRNEIEARIEELEDRPRAFTPDIIAIAGVVVTIGHDGQLEVVRGLVKSEDEPEEGEASESRKERPEFSAVLVESLTEAKSSAIGMSLAKNPDIALAAVVHALASDILVMGPAKSCLRLSASVTYYKADCDGADELRELRDEWSEKLPKDDDALWEWCLEQDREKLLELLAYCAGATVNAIDAKHHQPQASRLAHADVLAKSLELDMKAWFTPTAENYFGRVGRDAIVAAISEAKGVPAKRSWQKLKKSELAKLAEREIANTGWLPKPLRA
ncbi:MAG TPA: ParB/RepB/Spo0J family partition protein [Bryobacteraceae bacterium]|jgi:ParB family chromosome partitioning protein